jgi:hypothetical protein
MPPDRRSAQRVFLFVFIEQLDHEAKSLGFLAQLKYLLLL